MSYLTTCFNCGFLGFSDKFDIKTIVIFDYGDEQIEVDKCLCNNNCLEEIHKKGWKTKDN